MSEWTKGTFLCDGLTGRSERACWRHPAAPGLVLNRPHATLRTLWVVSHELGGRYVRPEWLALAEAQAFALQLARLGSWERPADEILRDVQLRAAVIQLRGTL